MQLTVIKKDKLNVFTLPENVSGNYWITDFENGKKINLVNIEADKSGWKLVSNPDAYITDSKGAYTPHVILDNYNFYILKNNYKNEEYYIYTSPSVESSYKELGIDANSKVKVGSDSSCEICYKLNTVPNRAFEISKKDKYYHISITDSKSNVYVNNKRVLTTKKLEFGDTIFIFGLKIVLMKRDGRDYLLINNPNNMLSFSALFTNPTKLKSEFQDDGAELSDDSLYKEDNYFYRTPYFYTSIEPFELSLDTPPAEKGADKTPAILTVGPMLTMSMSSLVMLIASMASGTANIASMFMAGAMLASSLLWPTLTKKYNEFTANKYNKRRVKLYRKYLDKKEEEINAAMEKQRITLFDNNMTNADAQHIILGHNVKLWQRRITDSNFLNIPVGLGDLPMQMDIKYPDEHFSLEEDSLVEMARELGKKERILRDVPVSYSFYNNVGTGIVGDDITTKDFADRAILQFIANYSYDELKLVLLTSSDNEVSWDYMKVLPHCWSNDKSIRYFGSNTDDYREIIYNIEAIYNDRKTKVKNNADIRFEPHYIIITDAIKSIDNYEFIKDIMTSNEKYGFSVIMLADKISALPNECKNFINVNKEECAILSSEVSKSATRFKMDYTNVDDLYNCARELANIPINIKSEAESSLPEIYQFLEMYQIGKVEQLNSLERWKKNNPILSLQAPVGIGKSGEIITLDLHEKYHGPHGLIAGTTGSGKSEFIITFILSLAVNYHPDEVQMILIDYKGGSLAGSFVGDGFRLPHLAGTITNLDGNELNRSLASIESEIKRRQAVFNEARRVANESSIDIYKYQKLYREGRLNGMGPVAHLFIISDEFAELKEQQPEFMDKLISVARVGRSLGVHLILATQKPGGVVDSQIWSNSRFKVCLKVQDTEDSKEVLKKPDAAYLKGTGRFYLQVGYDEVYTLGQAAWAGGQYYPNTTFKKEVDTSINLINNIGFVTSTLESSHKVKIQSVGEELPNIVKYLYDIAEEQNIKIKKLWLDKIPENIYIDALLKKYSFQKEPYYLEPIIGEYDDPDSQNQFVLKVPFTKLGNVLLYGIAGSGKEMFLQSLIYSSIISYKPEEVNFYIVDFGSETLRIFKDIPHVGDIVYLNDEDKLNNLFKVINGELEARKKIFSEYGGNYYEFIKNAKKSIPNIVIIINNYEAFLENYEDISDQIVQMSRDCYKYGIYFVISATSDSSVRLRLKQNFALIYTLQQNNDADYTNILGNIRGRVPAKLNGRGLFKKGGIYEFQTARIVDDNVNSFVNNLSNEMKEKYNYKARRIPVLPEVVDFDAVKRELNNTTIMPVGVNKKTLAIEKYNFKKNPINLVCAQDLTYTNTFINALIRETVYLKQYHIIFINTSDIIFDSNVIGGNILTKDFDNVINKIYGYVKNVYDNYQASGFDSNSIENSKKYMIYVYGVSDFINKLNQDSLAKFKELINMDNQVNVISFIFIDDADTIRSFAYEDWFKNGTDTTRGIWIGNGISDQMLFRISNIGREEREEISPEYGYIIQSSKASKIKLLSEFYIEE